MANNSMVSDEGGSLGHLLLVEDEALIALAEKEMLQRAGYEVTIAGDGDSAFEVATTQPVDLILMDIDLGSGISGADAARKILAVRDIPLVFLTNHSDARTLQEVASIPRYGYVLKSNGETILLEVIRLALARAADRAAVGQARDLYQSVVNLTGDIIGRHDSEGNVIFLNDHAYEVLGVSRIELGTINFLEYVAAEDRERIREGVGRMKETRQPVFGDVNRIRTVDGWRTYQWNGAAVVGPDGSYQGFQATGHDITAQKEAEERIRVLLEERELLLRELHHRVKNDLNIVHSLLSLQASQTTHTEAQQALSEAGDRVRTLAGIYETLNARDVTTSVFLRPLIETITDKLGHVTFPESVTVTRTLADVTVPVRLSVSIGIIYNELITNSVKHTLSGRGDLCNLVVTLDQSEEPREVVLTVGDDGGGFPPEILDGTQYGFGLTVVESLVSQHGGSLVLENAPGAHTTVTLPIPAQE